MYAHQSISSVHRLGSKLFDRPSYRVESSWDRAFTCPICRYAQWLKWAGTQGNAVPGPPINGCKRSWAPYALFSRGGGRASYCVPLSNVHLFWVVFFMWRGRIRSKCGVATKLKARFPLLLTWHCFNHRLELTVSDAIKSTTQVITTSRFSCIQCLPCIASHLNVNGNWFLVHQNLMCS